MIVPRAERIREPRLHPTRERLARFARGEAWRTERIVLEAHLFHCTACTRVVAEEGPPPDESWRGVPASPSPAEASGAAGFDRLWARVEGLGQVRWPSEAAVLPPTVLAELEPAERWAWTNLWPSGTRFTVLVREPSAGTELYLAYYGRDSAFPMHYHVQPEDNVILAGGYKSSVVGREPSADDQVLTGDWVLGEQGTRHSPRTGPEEECWCLSQVHVGGSKLETFHGKFQAWLDAWEARRERLR
jgi:putative transcriptional regulator